MPTTETPKPLDRKTQKIFAGSVPPEDNIAIFGSLAAPIASPKDEDADQTEGGGSDENASVQEIFSDDPDKIQNDAYKKGWAAAVVSDDSPALEDMNALFYLITRQLAYLYEKGIPEWDPDTIYYKGSVCLHPQSKKIYLSKKDGENPVEPGTDETAWFELGSDKVSITEFIAALATKADAAAFAAHTANKANPHGVTKLQVELDQVDNTSDLKKPISDATKRALDEKADQSDLNQAEERLKLKVEAAMEVAHAKLESVFHDATLSGNGTAASPLSAGPLLTLVADDATAEAMSLLYPDRYFASPE